MSHSKFTKRGHSLYLENWNPEARKFINICVMCNQKGYSPALDEEDFCRDVHRKIICRKIKEIIKTPLKLDDLGRCEHCAELIDNKKSNID